MQSLIYVISMDYIYYSGADVSSGEMSLGARRDNCFHRLELAYQKPKLKN